MSKKFKLNQECFKKTISETLKNIFFKENLESMLRFDLTEMVYWVVLLNNDGVGGGGTDFMKGI